MIEEMKKLLRRGREKKDRWSNELGSFDLSGRGDTAAISSCADSSHRLPLRKQRDAGSQDGAAESGWVGGKLTRAP